VPKLLGLVPGCVLHSEVSSIACWRFLMVPPMFTIIVSPLCPWLMFSVFVLPPVKVEEKSPSVIACCSVFEFPLM